LIKDPSMKRKRIVVAAAAAAAAETAAEKAPKAYEHVEGVSDGLWRSLLAAPPTVPMGNGMVVDQRTLTVDPILS
jgi:hypothetical protein